MGTYEEFSLLEDNIAEVGLKLDSLPLVRRLHVELSDGFGVSAIRWGSGDPEVVFLHGGAQNAHTWDTVILALGCPALAIDLPGHGYSDWRPKKDYAPDILADLVAEVIEEQAPSAEALIGMSLGGLVGLFLADIRPDLVRKLGLVDIAPGIDEAKAEPIVAFVSSHEIFKDFAAILSHTVAHNPTRSESSLHRGVLHNARQSEDGSWSWRWDPGRDLEIKDKEETVPDFCDLWERVAKLTCPIHLWLGEVWSVVADQDVEEFRRHQPNLVVSTVMGAGHSVQGDRPLELACLIEDLLSH